MTWFRYVFVLTLVSMGEFFINLAIGFADSGSVEVSFEIAESHMDDSLLGYCSMVATAVFIMFITCYLLLGGQIVQ